MTPYRSKPGPDAARAFRLGIVAGGLVGLAVAALLYWFGTMTLFAFGYVFVLLFPVYLVLVAIGLSVWLGYDQDVTSLRPVYRTER
ncbi:hypothetical protein [Halobellus captivus]|uniref:hypothetical protein n=1 Tax=Halobellus captivus TaxID=2592614 RepID=UPI00119F1A6C|nr:hypothetical protein [Halobellus captivus]